MWRERKALHPTLISWDAATRSQCRIARDTSLLLLAQPISMSGWLDPKNMFPVHPIHALYTATI